MTDSEFARAAARRFLFHRHAILLCCLDRHDVAMAVLDEAAARDIDEPDVELMNATIEQIKTVRPAYVWTAEEPICGAEPEDFIAGMGCKPCSLPAGHAEHRYPYPLPAQPEVGAK